MPRPDHIDSGATGRLAAAFRFRSGEGRPVTDGPSRFVMPNQPDQATGNRDSGPRFVAANASPASPVRVRTVELAGGAATTIETDQAALPTGVDTSTMADQGDPQEPRRRLRRRRPAREDTAGSDPVPAVSTPPGGQPPRDTQGPRGTSDGDDDGPGRNEEEGGTQDQTKPVSRARRIIFGQTGTARGAAEEIGSFIADARRVYASPFRGTQREILTQTDDSLKEGVEDSKRAPTTMWGPKVKEVIARSEQAREKSGVSIRQPWGEPSGPEPRVAYPYQADWRDQEHPITLPTDVADMISGVQGPIIELSGPKQHGYRLLKGEELLPSAPVVTHPYVYDNQTVEGLDPRDLPFADNSIGMFMIGHMANVDWQAREADEKRKKVFGVMEQQDRWSRQAEEEIGRLTADPSLEPQHNMIAKALGEVARTLSPNGLLMWDRASDPYVEYAAQLGLEVVHREVDWNDVILRGYGKPTEIHYATLFRKVPLAERQAPLD